jgi:hypothetical protein
MTITAVTHLGIGGGGAGTGNPVIMLEANAPAGRLVFVGIAKKNVAGADGTTSEILNVVDDVGGNTWQSAGAFCNAQSGRGAGIYVDLWYSVLKNGLLAGHVIGIQKSTDVACTATAYMASLTNAIARTYPAVSLAGDDVPLGSMSTSGLLSMEHLHVRITATDTTVSGTPTAGWTALVPAEISEATSVIVLGEFKVSTSTGETSAPSIDVLETSASVLVAISEAALHVRTALMVGSGTLSSAAIKSRTYHRTVLYAAAGAMSSVRGPMTQHRTAQFVQAASMSSLGILGLIEAPPSTFSAFGSMSATPTFVAAWHPKCEGDPWILTWGIWRDLGEWEDDDVWQDGPPVRHTRSLIMLEGSLKPASNMATWTERLELYEGETGHGIDLVEEVECITVTLRDIYTSEIVLRGDIDDGSIHIINPGIIEWSFPPEIMSGLDPKSYDAGCLVEFRTETVQVFLGHVSVRRGL